ncbi:hypothetical protein JCM16418_1789 [Paenibacillus pini JCM 16418]|uniref:Uncharacterized protein n=2 Tax=Paenibacillus TaxID=44249 RepID=W7YSZ2_9BACL|nr:hypothetical protein JCM16418_1789 [Paenibacillus pini JCM 16418]
MMTELFFKDNFFSAGYTQIMDRQEQAAGSLDLKSAFGSSLDVYNGIGELICSGKFRFFSRKWEVSNGSGNAIGVLRERISFLAKKYEYDAGERGVYDITSPAFSKEYTVYDQGGQRVALFDQTSSWLQSGAFRLQNHSTLLDSYELIAVVMGVHAIRKHHQNGGSPASL